MLPEREQESKRILASKVSEIRRNLGLSRAELAHLTGTSSTTIQNYESTSGTWPPIPWLYRLAEIAKLDIWDILYASEISYRGSKA